MWVETGKVLREEKKLQQIASPNAAAMAELNAKIRKCNLICPPHMHISELQEIYKK